MKNLTDDQKAKVIARMTELAPLNMEIAEKIADEFDIKARSVIASAVRNKIEYVKKARVSKTGGEVISKDDLVARIAENLGFEVADLVGLEKANKSALEILASAKV